jgi:hypothetical protein
MGLSPAVILYDASGVAHAVQDGVAIPASTPRLLVAGAEGTTARTLRTAADGTLRTDPTGTTTQPISATALPLPTGAATETTLASLLVNSADIETILGLLFTNSADIEAILAAIRDTAGVKKITDPVQVEGRAAEAAAAVGAPVRISGWDGTLIRTLLTDVQGRLSIVPAGANATTKGFSFGQVVLAATTVAPVRGTAYIEQTSNAQRSLVSTSASDAAAGTGARKVKITYYTATFTGPFEETVTLNGTTAVNTVATDICYIEKLDVTEVGSGGVAAGVISLKAATGGGGATIWSIAATFNQTHGAHHYVATGKTCFITGQLVGIKGADTTSGFLRSLALGVANAAEAQISDQIRAPTSGQSFRSYGTPITVVGPARIVAYAAPDSSSSRTYYASFDFYEE